MAYEEIYKSKLVSVEEAAKAVRSGDRIWMSSVGDTPVALMEALGDRYEELEGVELYTSLVLYPLKIMQDVKYRDHIKFFSVFMGSLERKYYDNGNVFPYPCHFGRFGEAMRRNIKPNVLITTCSAPDENGYMSYGIASPSMNPSAMDTATKVIVQVNKKQPFVFGERCNIHVRDVDVICEQDYDPIILPNSEPGEIDRKIASYISPMIEDGSTLQVGIGNLGNAVAQSIEDKKDLGVHTEMMVDALMVLAKKGVINCSKKNLHPGKLVYSFAAGSQELHDYLDKNVFCHAFPMEYVNDYNVIASNDKMVSINAALSVDLTGQACSESFGPRQFSATGGQLEFVRGAAKSKGGKSFIALSSTAKNKKDGSVISKITFSLEPGSVVTTPRSDIMYVVTEYGVADLYLQSVENRARALIKIAHPDFRDELTFQAKKAGYIY